MALLIRCVEDPEQRQATAQTANYVALFRICRRESRETVSTEVPIGSVVTTVKLPFQIMSRSCSSSFATTRASMSIFQKSSVLR